MAQRATSPSTDSPYRRDNYFAASPDETEDEASTRDWGTHHQFKQRNDPNEIIAHKLLLGTATKLCATTLNDAPYNGGRTAELIAWLEADVDPDVNSLAEAIDTEQLIDGHGDALHHENREVELSAPTVHVPKQASDGFGTVEYGQYRHRRRVNEETGYVSGGESTGVWIQDRSIDEFMELVGWYLHDVRDDIPPKLRNDAKSLAKHLKVKGELRDVDIMTRVVRKVRDGHGY